MKAQFLTLLLMIVLGTFMAHAKPSAKGTVAQKSQRKNKKSKSVDFEDLLVQGKYHFADEAIVTVEKDKVLDGLLSVRKDFKDRIKKSASLYE